MSFETATRVEKPKRSITKDLNGLFKLSFSTKAAAAFATYIMLGVLVFFVVLAIHDLFPELTRFVGVPGLSADLIILAMALYRVLSAEVYLGVVVRPVASLLLAVPVSASMLHSGYGGSLGDWIGEVVVTGAAGLFGFDWGYFISLSVMAATIAAMIVLAQLPAVPAIAWLINVIRASNYAQAFEPSVTSSRVVADTESMAVKETPSGVVGILEGFGITGVQGKGVINGPVIQRHLVKLPRGVKLSKLPDPDDIARELHVGSAAIEKNAGQGCIGIDIPRPKRIFTKLSTALESKEWKGRDKSLRLPFMPAVDVYGSPVVADLAEMPHLFIAGTTGSGKSVLAQAILLTLLQSGTDLRLLVADGKDMDGDFAPYFRKSSLLVDADGITGVATEIPDMAAQIRWLEAEMDRRYKTSDKPFPIVLIVDELADIIMLDPSIEASLVRIAQKGRAALIAMILCTQRPDAKTFTGLLRSNVPSRFGLFVQKKSESEIIIDTNGCEKLLGKGDALFKFGSQIIRAHGLTVTPADMNKYMV